MIGVKLGKSQILSGTFDSRLLQYIILSPTRLHFFRKTKHENTVKRSNLDPIKF